MKISLKIQNLHWVEVAYQLVIIPGVGGGSGGASWRHDKQALCHTAHGAAAFLVMLFNDGLDGCSCDPPRWTGTGVSTRVMLSVEGEPALKKIGSQVVPVHQI